MLPHISAEENIPLMGRKVYINPNFHGQLQGRVNNSSSSVLQAWEGPAIHVNPHFLQRQREYQLQLQQQQQQQQQQQEQQQHQQQQQEQLVTYYQPTVADDLTPPAAKIISKASTCLVRKQPVKTVTTPTPKPATLREQQPLVSISKRKLVRQGATRTTTITTATITTAAASAPAKRTRYKLVRTFSIASISSTPLVKKRRSRDFVARYALSRTNEAATSKKSSLISNVLKPSVNKSLRMVSIHGVMYKKTAKNKLTKLGTEKTKAAVTPQMQRTNNSTGCTLFVRGTKFVLDPSGCRLTRVLTPQPNLNKTQRLRIDIGGLTYVSSPKAQNVFIRNTNHVSRAHLMTAKQRSLQLLNRSLVKTNVPCAIFQRLGKCAAHSRGKCRRLHDKRQVAICPSFLRGGCTKPNCLLSHNVTLEKMPVCRYYLRGICVREDCPYLHKKLSRKAEICIDFLRGYCARAADCNMRHEFVCPEFARRGKCELTNCCYCKQMKPQHFTAAKSKTKSKTKVCVPQTPIVELAPTPTEELPSSSRYFICESDKCEPLPAGQLEEQQDDDDNGLDVDASYSSSSLRQRPKLGTLPAFIPLGGSDELMMWHATA